MSPRFSSESSRPVMVAFVTIIRSAITDGFMGAGSPSTTVRTLKAARDVMPWRRRIASTADRTPPASMPMLRNASVATAEAPGNSLLNSVGTWTRGLTEGRRALIVRILTKSGGNAMTADATVKFVRRAYEAISAGDIPWMAEHTADDVVFHQGGRFPTAGTY